MVERRNSVLDESCMSPVKDKREALDIIDRLRKSVKSGEIEVGYYAAISQTDVGEYCSWATGSMVNVVPMGVQNELVFRVAEGTKAIKKKKKKAKKKKLENTEFQQLVDQARGSMLQE